MYLDVLYAINIQQLCIMRFEPVDYFSRMSTLNIILIEISRIGSYTSLAIIGVYRRVLCLCLGIEQNCVSLHTGQTYLWVVTKYELVLGVE